MNGQRSIYERVFHISKSMKMSPIDWVAFILLVVGGLNLGLIGLLNTDVLASVLGGADSAILKVVYILIGLSALYKLVRVLGKK